MNLYDANQVTLIVNNINVTGFDEDEMVSWSKDDENFTAKTDAQGTTAVAKNNKKTGTITINLDQTSPDLKRLKVLANSGKEFSIWAQCGTEKIGGSQGMIKKTPDGSFSAETTARQFEIQVFDFIDQ